MEMNEEGAVLGLYRIELLNPSIRMRQKLSAAVS